MTTRLRATRSGEAVICCPLCQRDSDGDREPDLLVSLTPGHPGSYSDPGDPPEDPQLDDLAGDCPHVAAWDQGAIEAPDLALIYARSIDALDARHEEDGRW